MIEERGVRRSRRGTTGGCRGRGGEGKRREGGERGEEEVLRGNKIPVHENADSVAGNQMRAPMVMTLIIITCSHSKFGYE